MRFCFFPLVASLFFTPLAPLSGAWAQDAKPPIRIIKASQPSSPRLGLPLRCAMGTDCWVMNYPDVGLADDGLATDPSCLSRTYDGHKGTDFAIIDKTIMDKGVDVLASADGTVLRIRDGEPDRFPTKEDLDQTQKDKKDCGNGVLIDHGMFDEKNWQTMSCHLQNGSVSVKPGQKVKRGDKIGRVGLSGVTEFPHLHLGVTRDGVVVDPFTGKDITQTCAEDAKSPLWLESSGVSYAPIVIGIGGFAKKPPILKELSLKNAPLKAAEPDANSLVFYTTLWGLRGRDIITLEIIAPSGDVFAKDTITQDKNRARQLYFVGREKPQTADFDKGLYRGIVTIKRPKPDGVEGQVFTQENTLTLN